MKKSKTALPFKIFTIILLIISFINVIIHYDNYPKSKYNIKNTTVSGTIIKCQNQQITINGKEKILINYDKPFKCKLGIKIKAIGKFTKPNENTIFHLFNYRKYLLSQKINYLFKAKKVKIINNKIVPLYKIKNNLTNYINTYKNKDYLKAFILGDSKEIDENVITSYRDNGISHLLAVSGMHITLLSAIILFVLNKLNKKQKINYIVVILFLIFYMFLTGFTPSVIRAGLMFVILTINKIINIKINSLYILLFILAIYLLYNPYMIYHLGFLLSFIVTFYIILFQKLISNCHSYFAKTFMISLIAFLASYPIIINNFFKINLLTPFINIIFVPLVSFVIYPISLLSLVIKPLDGLISFLTSIMEGLSMVLSNFEISLVLSHINILIIILYYLIITYALYDLKKKKLKGLAIFILAMIIHTNINYVNPNNYLTMIDVGQGDCIFIKLNYNKGNILIDTGGIIFSNYNLAKKKIIPYLNSEGISTIDYLILTHGDYDHIGEAKNIVDNIKIKNVIFNNNAYNNLEKSLIKKLNKKKINYYKSKPGLYIYYLQFLNYKTYESENDNSNIICFKNKFLLMGDAGSQVEEDLLKRYKLKNIEFLKVGHHGSKNSSSKIFINQINPKYSLISVGKNNHYGHPAKETLNNLKKSKIYRTDIDGSIKINVNNNKIETCN